jgi:hypothetical protein
VDEGKINKVLADRPDLEAMVPEIQLADAA